MGHVRITRLPKRFGWQEVIRQLEAMQAGSSDDDPERLPLPDDHALVLATARAAKRTLLEAKSLGSLSGCYELFLRLVDGSRRRGLPPTLADLQISVPDGSSATALLGAIDRRAVEIVHLRGNGGALDNIAVDTFRSVILRAVRQESTSLFGATMTTVEETLKKLGRESSVAAIGRQFFSEFMHRSLSFAITREMLEIRGSNGPLATAAQQDAFDARLRSYCWDVSKIVEDYSGGWYSKSSWQQSLGSADIHRFTSYAVEKLLSELPNAASA